MTVVRPYGVLDRLETESYPEPFLNPTYPYPLAVTYVHDGNGNVDLVTERKKVSAEEIVEEVTDPEYDVLDRLVSKRRYDGKVLSYGYDAKGNRTRVKDPDGVETTYTFDAQDRLETATTPSGTTTYRYWPDGLRKGRTDPNGLEEARCYDPAGRLSTIVTAKEAIADTCADPSRMVSRFDYAHDANGNRIRQPAAPRTHDLAGMRVHVFVSDPWEFGTECGSGPFPAVISSARADLLLLHLDVPIEYRGARLTTVLARPRHAPGTVERLVPDGCLPMNLVFLRGAFGAMAEVPDDAKEGMVPAVGSIETTSR